MGYEYELDEINEHDEDIDEPVEPEEGDYIITSRGYLGSRTVVNILGEGRYFEIGPDEDIDVAIREDMIREEFFPNVWIVSDHGDCHRTEV